MSKICDLVKDGRRLKGNRISRERSRVTKRITKFSQLNLQKVQLKTQTFNMTARIRNKTRRTIEKYGGIEKFLLNVKKAKLTDLGKKLRNKLIKKSLRNPANSSKEKLIPLE